MKIDHTTYSNKGLARWLLDIADDMEEAGNLEDRDALQEAAARLLRARY